MKKILFLIIGVAFLGVAFSLYAASSTTDTFNIVNNTASKLDVGIGLAHNDVSYKLSGNWGSVPAGYNGPYENKMPSAFFDSWPQTGYFLEYISVRQHYADGGEEIKRFKIPANSNPAQGRNFTVVINGLNSDKIELK